MASTPHYRSHGIFLTFRDVTLSVNKKCILSKVSGLARPGEMLAIMGPSGSGKTTLLNCLAGRQTTESGDILLNGEPITKRQRRKICYVLQEDIFFANLTLKQTIMTSALLRLPGKMAYKEKIDRVNEIIEALDLTKCLNTVIGSTLSRGLSGGEKKRANIASELLTNPELMLLDEPTSGLDSSTAYSLMSTLKIFAKQSNKTIITTIHQPSSQIFHMFHHVLLLCNGENAYFGDAKKILNFFEDLGFQCTPNYNPADFILEKVKDDENVQRKIVDASYAIRKTSHWPSELQPNSDPAAGSSLESQPLLQTSRSTYSTDSAVETNGSSPICCERNKPPSRTNDDTEAITVTIEESFYDIDHYSGAGDKWPTSFFNQYLVLTKRNFLHSKSRILSKLNLIQTFVLSLVCGLIWFQIDSNETSIRDKEAYLFFSMVYWSFVPIFDGVSSFPPERAIINKERLAGSYRLSAYYLAKVTSELPLIISSPTIYLTVSYFMAGLNGFRSFVLTWITLVVSCLTAQSTGLFFGACTMDFAAGLTCSSVYSLTIMLIGGFYIENLPLWLDWLKYLSYVRYSFSAVLKYEFTNGPDIRCAPANRTMFQECHNINTTHIPSETVLKVKDITWPVWAYLLILLAFVIVISTMGYLVLRFFRKPR